MRLGGECIVKVVGVFDTPSQINRTAVVLLAPDLEAMTSRSGQATSIGIKLTPEALQDIEAVRAHIAALMLEFSVVNTDGAGVDGRADGPGSRVAELIGA